VLVHLGASDFLGRFKVYMSHAQEWRQQFARLDSVDLRYEHQIVVNPDLQGPAKEPPLSLSAAKAAAAAGVKPAALVTHEIVVPKAVSPTPELAPVKPTANPKPPTTKKKSAKAHHHKPTAKKVEAKMKSAGARAPVLALQAAKQTPSPAPQAANPATTTPPNNNATKPQKPSAGIPKGQP
jgi:hypothetical protein